MNSKIIKADISFEKFLQEVKTERIKKDKDSKMQSNRRLTLAISRMPDLKKRLVEADLK